MKDKKSRTIKRSKKKQLQQLGDFVAKLARERRLNPGTRAGEEAVSNERT